MSGCRHVVDPSGTDHRLIERKQVVRRWVARAERARLVVVAADSRPGGFVWLPIVILWRHRVGVALLIALRDDLDVDRLTGVASHQGGWGFIGIVCDAVGATPLGAAAALQLWHVVQKLFVRLGAEFDFGLGSQTTPVE